MEVVPIPTTFMRNPHMCLKRKKLSLAVDLREGRKKARRRRRLPSSEREGRRPPLERMLHPFLTLLSIYVKLVSC